MAGNGLAGNVDFGGKNMDRLNMCVAFGGKMSKYRLIMEKRKSNQNCFRILCFGFRRAFPFQDVGGHSMPPYYWRPSSRAITSVRNIFRHSEF